MATSCSYDGFECQDECPCTKNSSKRLPDINARPKIDVTLSSSHNVQPYYHVTPTREFAGATVSVKTRTSSSPPTENRTEGFILKFHSKRNDFSNVPRKQYVLRDIMNVASALPNEQPSERKVAVNRTKTFVKQKGIIKNNHKDTVEKLTQKTSSKQEDSDGSSSSPTRPYVKDNHITGHRYITGYEIERQPGKLEVEAQYSLCQCEGNNNPVCGTDAKTYRNPCLLSCS